jgi:hypothetical protein
MKNRINLKYIFMKILLKIKSIIICNKEYKKKSVQIFARNQK